MTLEEKGQDLSGRSKQFGGEDNISLILFPTMMRRCKDADWQTNKWQI